MITRYGYRITEANLVHLHEVQIPLILLLLRQSEVMHGLETHCEAASVAWMGFLLWTTPIVIVLMSIMYCALKFLSSWAPDHIILMPYCQKPNKASTVRMNTKNVDNC